MNIALIQIKQKALFYQLEQEIRSYEQHLRRQTQRDSDNTTDAVLKTCKQITETRFPEKNKSALGAFTKAVETLVVPQQTNPPKRATKEASATKPH